MKWVWRGLAALLMLLLLAGTGTWLWLRTALPQTDGQVVLAALETRVTVTRDRHGIPRIEAENDRDAYFALGYVHAQDRLWQMDFQRRFGAGRLAEVTGPATLSLDRYMRFLGLYRLAEEQLALLSDEARAAVDAYTAGVNAWLETRDGALPSEFYLLRYRPEPWKAADSLVWGRMMAVFLSRNWREEALGAALDRKLTPEQIRVLLPPYPNGAPVTLSGLDNPLMEDSASNWWVLSGQHTESGKPLLANDPHLRLRAPALWYLARVTTPGWTVSGATVPGVPFHVIGHNARIAWGLSSAETDVEDLFMERVDPSDPGRYVTPEGPQPFVIREEVIDVRGGDAVILTVRSTRHGPVISDLQPELGALLGENEVMALSMAPLQPDDRSAEALFRLNRASDWDSFRDALRLWHSPHQHIAYADTDGNVGMIAPARIPMRRNGDGSRPVPGWDGRHGWTGFVPFEDLPQVLDPPSGRLANANNPVVGNPYPHSLGRNRTEGYRARRIEERLAALPTHDADSMAAIQRDAVSLAARDLLPLMLTARAEGERAERALTLLRQWGGTMDRTRPEPLIFKAWLRETVRTIFADELGALFSLWGGLRPHSVHLALTEAPEWCNDVRTPEIEDCPTALANALDAALTDLASRYGDGMNGWRWGKAHRARLAHPVLARIPVLGRLFSIEPEIDGGDFTIYRAQPDTRNERDPFAAVHGAGFRAVFDLSDLDASRFIVSTGQSGQVLSRHFTDLNQRWQSNDLLTISPDAGREAARLILVPPAPR
jgi:penicillin G amidase